MSEDEAKVLSGNEVSKWVSLIFYIKISELIDRNIIKYLKII